MFLRLSLVVKYDANDLIAEKFKVSRLSSEKSNDGVGGEEFGCLILYLMVVPPF